VLLLIYRKACVSSNGRINSYRKLYFKNYEHYVTDVHANGDVLTKHCGKPNIRNCRICNNCFYFISTISVI